MGDKEPTIRSRELGLALRRAVEAAGFDSRQLARKMGFSPSKVSNIFRATRGVDENDIAGILALCGIRGPARDSLLQLARESHEPGWWLEYEHLPQQVVPADEIDDPRRHQNATPADHRPVSRTEVELPPR
ncbi:helix-turn-helix protein [Herbihabitans rhizosphaerae]|uniref:Helix-turn-helix protein n=1 Tax=Herbihabitans rhizosphaerae TaxID=1872711 RepID=A0A4Q7L947_9PSEU|nr:helix-turn-helix transcriptional regulator [Herbihabitans rhizosphaerae]RZS44942.1 helix-turn-helix protein [Herbihabitans rhizosphaerae]